MAPRSVTPNPRGGDRRGTSRLTSRPSSPLWYGLALLLALGMVQAYYMTPPGRLIPYSEFKQLVKSGEVAEISIGDQSIRGTLKTNSGQLHVKTSPHWDLGTAVRYAESLGFKGLYTIEVDFDPAVRTVYNVVLANVS